MLAPLSWLKEFVDITIAEKNLAWRLTELGLGVEAVREINGEKIFELEITPNRPDLLSIIGIAREIAAIEHKSIKDIVLKIPSPSKKLPLIVKSNFILFPRFTAVIIDGVSIKPSPEWLQKRLVQLGLRPINNIVDITNFVMFELGIPLHAFDYNKVIGAEINVEQAKGGEEFTTVDELSYKLPKGAVVIKDSEKIIDLCGIKGGLNSGITNKTKTIILQTNAVNAVMVRKASLALALRSDGSAIFERGVDKGGLLKTLSRAVQLTLDLAGGEVASETIDIFEKQFTPWVLFLRISRLTSVLGVTIPVKQIQETLAGLGLNPILKGDKILVTVPTHREDLKIEEDLIEEVARVYGYNNFPVTLPKGEIPTKKIAYHKTFTAEEKGKNILSGEGYSEIYTYSLISRNLLKKINFLDSDIISITNPVNTDFEIMRPTLVGNVLDAIQLNKANYQKISLYELGKVYSGKAPNFFETRMLVMASTKQNYRQFKGAVEELLHRFEITNYQEIVIDAGNYFQPKSAVKLTVDGKQLAQLGLVKEEVSLNFGIGLNTYLAEINFELLEKLAKDTKFVIPSIFPPHIEDLALLVPKDISVINIITEIKNISHLIENVSLLDTYENTRTLRIVYHDQQKTLSDVEVKPLREKILKNLEQKFGAKLKIRL